MQVVATYTNYLVMSVKALHGSSSCCAFVHSRLRRHCIDAWGAEETMAAENPLCELHMII